MKLLAILVLFLFAFSSPVLARGPRCRSSTQCDYQSVCDEGYCMTIDEMFAKYDQPSYNGINGQIGRNGDGGFNGNSGRDGHRSFSKPIRY